MRAVTGYNFRTRKATIMNIGIVFLGILLVYILLTIIEIVGLHRFDLKYYQRGFKIFRKEKKIRFSNWNNLDGIYTQDEGKYVFVPDMRIGYFVTRFRFYRKYSLFAYSKGFPLTIYGSFYEQDNKLTITYFISYRLFALILLWFFVWTVLSIVSMSWIGLVVGVFGVLISALFIYLIKIFQTGKMLTMFDEIVKILIVKS